MKDCHTSCTANSHYCFALKMFGQIPKNTLSRTITLWIGGFFRVQKKRKLQQNMLLWILSSVTRHYMVLQLHKALWSNCKQMQSSESTFFLCKKYEKNCSFIHFSSTRWMSWMTYSSNSNGEYSDSSTRSSPSCFSTSRKPFDAVFTKEMFSGSSSVVVDVDDCWRSLQRSNN